MESIALNSGDAWLTGGGKKLLNVFFDEDAELSFCASAVAESKTNPMNM
jgi:hypothetical protein